MKYILVLCFSFSAFATVPDDALGHALQNLHGQVAAVDRSYLNEIGGAGWKVVDIGINLAGIIAIAKAATLTFTPGEHFILKTAGSAAAFGSMIGLIGTVGRWLRGKPRPNVPSHYQAKDGMNEFFRMTVENQYLVAAQDPALAQFIVQMSASYDALNAGFPARPDVPPAIP